MNGAKGKVLRGLHTKRMDIQWKSTYQKLKKFLISLSSVEAEMFLTLTVVAILGIKVVIVIVERVVVEW